MEKLFNHFLNLQNFSLRSLEESRDKRIQAERKGNKGDNLKQFIVLWPELVSMLSEVI